MSWTLLKVINKMQLEKLANTGFKVQAIVRSLTIHGTVIWADRTKLGTAVKEFHMLMSASVGDENILNAIFRHHLRIVSSSSAHTNKQNPDSFN